MNDKETVQRNEALESSSARYEQLHIALHQVLYFRRNEGMPWSSQIRCAFENNVITFEYNAFLNKCQYHKLSNVTSYTLPKNHFKEIFQLPRDLEKEMPTL